MAELMALEQCLDFLKQDNLQNIIIEVDSELIISSFKRICCGTEPEKVSSHWRLIQVFQRIQFHLLDLCTMSSTHVQRIANKLADILANQGVVCTKNKVKLILQEMSQNRLREQFFSRVEEDNKVFRNRTAETGSS